MFGIQTTIISVGVALIMGFGSGYYTAHRFDQTTELKQDLAHSHDINTQLAENINQMRAALDADAAKHAENATKIEELERTANDLANKTNSDVALTGDDTKRLLEWWNATRTVPTPKSRSRSR